VAIVDGGGGFASGLEYLDGKSCHENASSGPGELLNTGKASSLHYQIRRNSVRVTVDGREAIQWTGDFGRLSMNRTFDGPNPGALVIGAWESEFTIRRLTLTSFSGQGRKLR
jgi:hypothetical protein